MSIIATYHLAALFLLGDAAVQFLFRAEAVVGASVLDELFRPDQIVVHPLALDIGAVIAADVGAFVPLQAAILQSVINHVHGAFYEPSLVGVLYPEDEVTAVFFGYQVGI